MPYPRKIQERDFPSLLHSRLQQDLNIIDKNVNKKWEEIVPLLKHKGIRINPEKNTFYLSRIDEEACRDRRIHKYCKNTKLTSLIRYRVRNQKGEDLQFKEVVMDKSSTLLDLKKKHLNGRYTNQNDKGRVVFYEEQDKNKAFTEETLIKDLDEEKVYVVYVYV